MKRKQEHRADDDDDDENNEDDNEKNDDEHRDQTNENNPPTPRRSMRSRPRPHPHPHPRSQVGAENGDAAAAAESAAAAAHTDGIRDEGDDSVVSATPRTPSRRKRMNNGNENGNDDDDNDDDGGGGGGGDRDAKGTTITADTATPTSARTQRRNNNPPLPPPSTPSVSILKKNNHTNALAGAGAGTTTTFTPKPAATPRSVSRKSTGGKVLFVNASGRGARGTGRGGVVGASPATPSRGRAGAAGGGGGAGNADRSAKRKSVRVLVEPTEDDLWDGGDRLAREIWEEEGEGEAEGAGDELSHDDMGKGAELEANTTVESTAITPSKKQKEEPPKQTQPRPKRPRPRQRQRSPTPEGDLPPHEKYFFQNRPGPLQTSNNSLRGLSLLTHEEYFDLITNTVDKHAGGQKFLFELHERSYPQWAFELQQGFAVCLYGYGSKRNLVRRFAEWLASSAGGVAGGGGGDGDENPRIVIANGYVSGTTVRGILATIVEAIYGAENMPSKLGTQPAEVLGLIRAAMQGAGEEEEYDDDDDDDSSSRQRMKRRQKPVTVMINSIDAPPLRRLAHQSLLARLAQIPGIRLLATADTPGFPLLWDITLREQFNFVFHDCTTFEAYSTEEINVVDEFNSLLGRKVRRIGGKDGIGFVLKSLPENTRKLYRLLLTEVLTLIAEQHGLSDDDDDDDGGGGGEDGEAAGKRNAVGVSEEERVSVSWRTIYNKATEEFISSSEMMFRTQLKEFYDHQMVISRTDASGLETLAVPLSRDEMEAVLEELMME